MLLELLSAKAPHTTTPAMLEEVMQDPGTFKWYIDFRYHDLHNRLRSEKEKLQRSLRRGGVLVYGRVQRNLERNGLRYHGSAGMGHNCGGRLRASNPRGL